MTEVVLIGVSPDQIEGVGIAAKAHCLRLLEWPLALLMER
jgi:hypothetical protein